MNKRGSGVLLHITSLPSPYGIGDLGPWAYRFADFLSETRQSYWQVLPLSPTAPVYGNSPYSSISTFAGNTLLISPDILVEEDLISKKQLGSIPSLPEGRCDYNTARMYKENILGLAYEAFGKPGRNRDRFIHFYEDNASWLDDYALFVAMKEKMGGKPWSEWPWELRDRVPEQMRAIRIERAVDIEREKFNQYLFFTQWSALKHYCNQRGIQMMGDIPIYVSYDSADVWSNPGIFKLDGEKRPVAVAGVPPDYFSVTGQLWGNPVYNWDALRQTGYGWWIDRMNHILKMYDVIRIDHFRGLVAFWEVPAHEKNAVNGRWVEVPTMDFFNQLFRRFFGLPIVAEDLGLITPDVREAIRQLGFPGMKVLLFAFGEDNPMHIYLPHTYERNYVVYTGTHDNNTVRGWFEHEARQEDRWRLFRYLGREVSSDEASWELIRLAMMSIADMAMVPLQDILGLGREAQMNRPSVAHGNWAWRFLPSQLNESVVQRLRSFTEAYGRA
ncbi:MAG: 4-alpha-glucanotransferase [Syntrophorhabdaceae bacterium PtaU1.Bin034]|jgi:4-alpha-glucanotransferase|nr:MAG: 4-alpha-glucanotransferase [Syntrophorhabdaceae bacterium PtaU1.Bin034]